MSDLPTKMFVTTDALPLALSPQEGLRALVIRRANEPYKGKWALPGGFVEPEEDLPDACARELAEETGLRPAALAQIGAFGRPGRDPRGRNVSVAFLALIAPGGRSVRAGSDAAGAAWHPADELPPLGFDHAEIVAAGLERLRVLCDRTHAVFALLPETFDIKALRAALAAVHGRPVSAAEARALADRAELRDSGGGLLACAAEDPLSALRPRLEL